MLNVIETFFANLSDYAGLADIIDIVLVAVFLYGFIAWVRRSISERALHSIVILATLLLLVYVLARVAGLYLIENVAEVFFLLLAIGTVIVFQADIRQMIDNIGNWRTFPSSAPDAGMEEAIDVLTEAASHMAESQTGAIIAIRGQESWDRQIHGGIPLKGTLSEPLLYSLFNPSSPAHDGAVLVEVDHVIKFGAHLPLSTQLTDDPKYGTRHAAALGLAERCDALVIVVSEERGEISIAENGLLTHVKSASEVKRRLEAFWYQHYNDLPSNVGWLNRRSFQTTAISVLLALLLWVVFAYQPNTHYRPYDVPIVVRNLPAAWALVEPVPTKATVILEGPEQAFRGLNPDELAIYVNIKDPEEGINKRTLTGSNLQMPEDVELFQISPQEVTFEIQKMRSERGVVRVPTTGELQVSSSRLTVAAEPDTVTLLVPEDHPLGPIEVLTSAVNLSEISRPTTLTKPLHLSPGLRLAPKEPSEITVTVDFQPPPPEQK